jgi:menaquinone-dependent protoporphyrinogen oxidase
MPVLITYATLHGSTREVAEHIASRLYADGFAVECRPVDHVCCVENYSAVIIGSAVHSHKWLLDAQKFIDSDAVGLRMRPTWAFSVGMVLARAPPWMRESAAEKEVSVLEKVLVSRVPNLREHRLFAGKDDGSTTSKPCRGLYRCLGRKFGDMRDWNEINIWTDMVATQLKREGI